MRLNLALQGGGAHGAFTWGVLDRLLATQDIEIAWVSGTSAGAVNAVALAAGCAEGGNAAARRTLRNIWEGVIEAGVPNLLRFNPFLNGLSRSSSMARMASLFSPYEFNPLGFDPLRRLLTAHIDFEKLRAVSELELLIAATDIASARAKLFRRAELTVDHVLASACLPTLHHAVEIDGRYYWDGGFTANPELTTLAAESPVGDTLLVQLTPLHHDGVPRTTRGIAAAVDRIAFTQPLLRHVAEVVAMQREVRSRRKLWRRPTHADRVGRHRWHLIAAGDYTGDLAPDTKLRPDRAILTSLYEAGRHEADRWIERHANAVGRTSTVDLEATFFAPLSPLAPESATELPDMDEEAGVIGTFGTDQAR